MTPRMAMIVPVLAAALLQQAPPRDGTAQIMPGTGTATVSGRVLAGPDGSEPARKARVMLNSVDRRIAGQTVTTDDDGRFEFRGVPDGRFLIEAQKAGYLRGAYGSTRPNRAGTPVSVATGARLDGLTIRLVHGAAITGTVRDTRGRPVPGVSCSALRFGYSATGERMLAQAATAVTDDLGEYRVWGLPPGEFVVMVTPRDPANFGAFQSNDFAVLTAGDVDRALQGGSQAVAVAPASAPRLNYAPVFFPGTPDVARATTIVLPAAADRQGIDLIVDLFRTARIDGTIVSRDGQPVASARVTLAGAGDSANLLGDVLAFRGWAVTSDREGRFTIQDVWPGTYRLKALTGSATDPAWAMTDVTVNGDAINVALTMQPAMTIAGSLVFDGQSPSPSDPSTLSIRLVPPGSGSNIGTGPPGGAVSADGTFSFSGVTPGAYRMLTTRRTQAPWNWFLRSAVAGGQDVLNGALTIGPGESPTLVLTYTDRPTEVSGEFQDATGRPAPDYFIVAFPEDRALWTPGSRRIASTRPDNSGLYVMRGLPPGEYLIAALTDLDSQDLYSPAFFEQLIPLALKVTLAEGVVTKRDLRVGR